MEGIKEYYDKLAKDYDQDRFGNSYGKYIDKQERAILKKLLKNRDHKNILDLGCGTGRFLEFAEYGVDISTQMIAIAKLKFPDKKLQVAAGANTPFENTTFDVLFSFHVMMHLDKQTTNDIINEANRVLKKGGLLIFDVPSKTRRQLVKHDHKGWHGANDYTLAEIKKKSENKWNLKKSYGVAFLPVHSIPKKLRSWFVWLDNLICRSFLKKYSSYLIIVLEKK